MTTLRDERGGVAGTDADTRADGNGAGTDTDNEAGTGDADAEPTALEAAEDAYSAARSTIEAVAAAVTAFETADTRETRDALQDAVGAARERLDEAVDAADAAVAAAEGGSAAAIGAAARARNRAIELRTGQARALDDAEGSTGWSTRSAVARPVPALAPPFDADSLDRRLREDADGNDSPTLLKAADIPPIMHEDGKTVMAVGAGSSGDRLRMRGMPLIYYTNRTLVYGFAPSSETSELVVENLASIRNNRPDLVAGLRITRDGLVVDMGGKYAEGTDFRVGSFAITYEAGLRVLASRPGSGAGKGYDLTLDFGRPTASPEGNAEHYWTGSLMPTPDHVSVNSWLTDGDRVVPLGVYQVRLSNHIGLDRHTEDPDEPYPDDDINSYLSYAAYGFMDFFRPDPPVSSAVHGIHRVFPFHVGYDAFKDEARSRTADVAAEDRIARGKFKGRTIAARFGIYAGRVTFTHLDNFKRMRGDVELTATIGTASDTITGKISNMEDWDPKGYWKPSTTVTSDIEFASDGRIDAKGEFTGTFANYPAGFERGGYRGNFYGPLDSLEAAGTWAMSPASGQQLSIAGSFGAALVRPDGSYGAEVPASN